MYCCQARTSKPLSRPGRLGRPRLSPRVRCEPQTNKQAPDLTDEQQQALKTMMDNPQVQQQMAALSERMKTPEMQQQMAQMQASMANPQLQQRLSELRDDDDMKEMFEDIQKNGMGALMKYWNDPEMLAKLGRKVGDIEPSEAAQPEAPQLNDLLDAARAGDEEAVEDLIAVGKDPNIKDTEGRGPLHYAVATNKFKIASMLVEAGMDLEALDSKNNSALHYAAGYGSIDCVRLLVEKGAATAPQNHTGKTAADLARLNPQNPVCLDAELMAKLDPATAAQA